jgi:Lon protease-like protein
MSHLDPNDLTFDPDEFSGVARLFPLPGLVLFPHVMQPLHVFEPRYRQLLEDVMASDRLMTLALIHPDGATDQHGREKICEYACLGKVVTYQRLENGRFNVLLMGVSRVRIVAEHPSQRMYRVADAQIVDDLYGDLDDERRMELRAKLLDRFRRHLPSEMSGAEHLERLFGTALPLGVLTDVIAYTLAIQLEAKQQLLAMPDVDARAQRLLSLLAGGSRPSRFVAVRGYPPPFSSN